MNIKFKQTIGSLLTAIPVVVCSIFNAAYISYLVKNTFLEIAIPIVLFFMQIGGVYLMIADHDIECNIYLNRIRELDAENKRLQIIVNEFKK